MADRGVNWLVRWVWDKSSRGKVEQEARETGQQAGTALKREIGGAADESRGAFRRFFSDAREGAQDTANRFRSAWGRAISALKSPLAGMATAVAGVFAVRRMAQFGKEVVQAGINARETASAYTTTFGQARESLDSFLEGYTLLAGITEEEGQKFLVSAGSIAQGLGIAQAASADFSQTVLQMAGDLTSFRNVPLEQTTRAITSAVVGEREALKSLGIVVRETDVQKQAMLETGKQTAEQLTDEERAWATLSLVYERMGVQVGDLNRTRDSEANKLRRAQGLWRSLKVELGLAVLETGAMGDGLGTINELLTTTVRWLRDNRTEIAEWGSFTLRTIEAVATALSAIIRLAFNFGQAIAETLNVAGGGLGLLLDTIIDKIPGVDRSEAIAEDMRVINEGMAGLKDAGADVANILQGVGDAWIEAGKKGLVAIGAMESAAAAQEDLAAGSGPGAGGGVGVEGLGGVDFRAADFGATIAEGRRRKKKKKGPITTMIDPDELRMSTQGQRSLDFLRRMQDELDATREAADVMAENMVDSLSNVWAAFELGEGSAEDVLNAVVASARGVGAAVMQELVRGKVEYHTAEAAGKLATGIWPPNPAAILAASKHIIAAGLFKAIPGVVGGGGGMRGGGGFGGAGGLGTGIDRDRLGGRFDPMSPTFTFYIDANDPQNPVFQEAVHQGYVLAEQRFGGNVQVFPMGQAPKR